MNTANDSVVSFLDDLTTRDQRMMFAVLTMVHTAETKEQLDNDTEALLTTARKHLCQFELLTQRHNKLGFQDNRVCTVSVFLRHIHSINMV